MLYAKERTRIQRYVNKAYSGMVKEGEPVNRACKKVEVPTLEELRKKAVDLLSYHGFCVEEVPIPEANIVVRVYRDTDLKFDNQTCWAYGIEVFGKAFFGMWSTASGDPIQFTKKQIKIPLQEGGVATTQTENFKDYYLKIT